MINAIGIIAEYNPFHNGHLHHLNEAKKVSGLPFAIAVMSGNFLQRGEPAITDKWSRAAMAVKTGVDLVIELPAVFSVRSAQYFAAGGVQLLKSLGIVSHICFGAETADIAKLQQAAQALAQNDTVDSLRQEMKTGRTYAASLAAVLSASAGVDGQLLQSPNNLLAIEYLRAITKYAPDIIPLAVQRMGAGYHDKSITASIASATAIRAHIIQNGGLPPGSPAHFAMPATCARQLNDLLASGKMPVTLESFSSIILAKLRSMGLTELAALPDVAEGLHNKISDAAFKATTAQELLMYIKSKRYTLTRLQRIMIHALIGTSRNKLLQFDHAGPLYARVLAFNHNGRKLLKEIENHAEIPVITKTAHYLTSKQQRQSALSPLQAMLAYDVAATDMYVLGFPNCAHRSGSQDFHFSPQYIAD